MTGLSVWLFAGIPVLVVLAVGSLVAGVGLGTYAFFSANLPDIPDLRAYRPKTVSTFFAEDDTPIGIFYREKRFPVAVGDIPPHVVQAFLAAEDARFFSHPGVDWLGVARALIKNIQAKDYAQGASTITQQVTRNFVLTLEDPLKAKEKKLSRKIREAILSFRLEKTLSKQEILGLYLNEIYLGRSAYGVESAARTYFGKNCSGLTVAEAALLAGLVASPSKFSPARSVEAALERRSIVLATMLRNNFISPDQYEQALQEKPQFREELPNPYQRAPYFAEAVRQYIVEKYGEERLLNEGLQVMTTCDLNLQNIAAEALENGVIEWEKRQRRPTGLAQRLTAQEAKAFLASGHDASYKVGDTVKALVIKNNTPSQRKKGEPVSHEQDCALALPGDLQFRATLTSPIPYRPNDLLEFRVTSAGGSKLSLQPETLPPVEGAVVCIENRTGYVRALVGGLDFERSRFNRAHQAKRQPGSSFKPFVYAAALQWAYYSPYSMIVDEPIAVVINPRDQEWVPMNSDHQFLGPITFRQALAQSRNVATVKLLMDVGIDATIHTARGMGIVSPLGKNLSISLGAAEVTPLELTSAYTVFPNLGMKVAPVLVKKVLDRFGRVLEDNTSEPLAISQEALAVEEATEWLRNRALLPEPEQDSLAAGQNQAHRGPEALFAKRLGLMRKDLSSGVEEEDASDHLSIESLLASPRGVAPAVVRRRPEPKRALSPQTAYLMTSILRDVCVSGTGAAARRLGRRDLAGKTGTTDDCTDAWFVGFNPRYTAGVWIGYDAKVSLGKAEYGARAALPVWMAFMKEALAGQPVEGYPAPPGLVFHEANVRAPRSDTIALLEAGPDLAAHLPAKAISPVDAIFASSGVALSEPFGYSGDMGPGYAPAAGPRRFPGQFIAGPLGQPEGYFGGYVPSFYPGMIRVLSPTGETLGHAPYSFDERGRAMVHREGFTPSHVDSYDSDHDQDERPDRWRGAESEQATAGGEAFLPRAARFFRDLGNFFQLSPPTGRFR
ncbi:MAG: penicillin-binding protein 1A [Deltaproteobacteria bacterium]|nr:penicillin-binding protein 1A [Deltaproteobacteria bacterium]